MISGRVLRGAGGVVGFILLAELAGRVGVIDSRLVPPPSTVLVEAGRLLADAEFLEDLLATLQTWFSGLLIAIAVAVPAGVVLGTFPAAERATRPIVEFLRPIPSVALIPLAILLVPDDILMKISVIVYASLWPILINTMYGMRDVDPIAKESLRSFGFSAVATLWRVSLPSAAPFIVTGVRIALGIALILAVSAELLAGGTAGIGVFVTQAGSGNRTDLVLAATLWAGVIGLVANLLLVGTERRLFRWHHVRTGAPA